jgi:type IV pilus assembly protein PilY1
MYGLIDDGARVGTRAADLVRRTTVAVGTINGRTVRGFEPSDTTAIPADKKGWFVDFAPPAPGTVEGERMIGDPAVVASVLQFSSIIPSDDLCEPGGRGFINAINPFTGASVSDNFFDVDGDGQYTDDNVGSGDNEVPVGSVDTGVGMNTDGLMLDKIIGVGGSQGNTGSVGVNNPVAPGRVSWRELLGD